MKANNLDDQSTSDDQKIKGHQLSAGARSNSEEALAEDADEMPEQLITLVSDDGKEYTCKILWLFGFESKEYALLLKVAGEGEEEEAQEAQDDEENTVIMQLIENEDEAIFRTIESEEEFERVVAFVRNEVNKVYEDEED